MRKQFIAGKGVWNDRIDKDNTVWLKKVVSRYGWPTVSAVGKRASHGAWLLIQHADHDIKFQKKVLKLLKETFKESEREIELADVAYLTDRVLIHEKRPQVFGTQFRQDKSGKFRPFPIKDKQNVDKRRVTHGLSSLDENIKIINKEYKNLDNEKT